MSEVDERPLDDVFEYVCAGLAQGLSDEDAIGFAAFWCGMDETSIREFVGEYYPAGLARERAAQETTFANMKDLRSEVEQRVDRMVRDLGLAQATLIAALAKTGDIYGGNLRILSQAKNIVFGRFAYLQKEADIPARYHGIQPIGLAPARGTWRYHNTSPEGQGL